MATVKREGGLGLVLAELWAEGGRGMVLVEEVVPGSNAAVTGGGIAVGDTVVGVVGAGGLALGIDTEGRDWDTTIEALTSIEGDELVSPAPPLAAVACHFAAGRDRPRGPPRPDTLHHLLTRALPRPPDLDHEAAGEARAHQRECNEQHRR